MSKQTTRPTPFGVCDRNEAPCFPYNPASPSNMRWNMPAMYWAPPESSPWPLRIYALNTRAA